MVTREEAKEILEKLTLTEEKHKRRLTKKESVNVIRELYTSAIKSFQEYVDIKPIYHTFISIWAVGALFHDKFESYPYLFLNAMKGSGKSRTLKLIMKLIGGDVATSMTEAVLFRNKEPLAIDEFEGIGRKGQENLRELLNAAYKRGSVVFRMKQKKIKEETTQIRERFDVYRPIALANIWGMEEVLGDRCISSILEKSNNKQITRRLEDFDYSPTIKTFLEKKQQIPFISDHLFPERISISRLWNEYINSQHSQHSHNSLNSHNSLINLFNKIEKTGIYGRELELFFPLFVISYYIGEDVLDNLIDFSYEIIKEKRESSLIENYDVKVIDFVSQYTNDSFVSIKQLTQDFKDFLQSSEEWINEKWLGRRLKTLVLVKEKKKSSGIYVILDIEKAQQKIKMFVGDSGIKGVSGV